MQAGATETFLGWTGHTSLTLAPVKGCLIVFMLFTNVYILPSLHPILLAAAAAAKSLQSCPTLCDPRDSSPPGFPIPGILQARTLEWVAISFSNA